MKVFFTYMKSSTETEKTSSHTPKNSLSLFTCVLTLKKFSQRKSHKGNEWSVCVAFILWLTVRFCLRFFLIAFKVYFSSRRAALPGIIEYTVFITVTSRNTCDLLLTLRRLMSYIYGAPILDVSRSHTTTQHSR